MRWNDKAACFGRLPSTTAAGLVMSFENSTVRIQVSAAVVQNNQYKFGHVTRYSVGKSDLSVNE